MAWGKTIYETHIYTARGELIKLKVQKLYETGEWVVRHFQNGKYIEDYSYFTDDRKDALMSSDQMALHLRGKLGHILKYN